MRSMLDTYMPRYELDSYFTRDKLMKIYVLQEVFIHYCVNNDIDLRYGMHEDFNHWAQELQAQMYYDMKVHESRDEFEHCSILKHLIRNIDIIYRETKERFV